MEGRIKHLNLNYKWNGAQSVTGVKSIFSFSKLNNLNQEH